MTVLVLALALDCAMTPTVAQWAGAGTLVRFERLLTTSGTIPTRITDDGCTLGFANDFEPDLISWCNFLGPDRCRLEIRP